VPNDPRQLAERAFLTLHRKIKRRLEVTRQSIRNVGPFDPQTERERALFETCKREFLRIRSVEQQHTIAYVSAQIGGWLTDSIARGADASDGFDSLLRTLTDPTGESRVFFFLKGIDLRANMLPFALGFFRHFNADEAAQLTAHAINRDLTETENQMLGNLDGRFGVEFRVNASHAKAIEIATLRAEWLIASLNFLSSLEFGDFGVQVTIDMGVISPGPPILIISKRTWQTLQMPYRGERPFKLMINVGLDRLFRKHGIEGILEVLAAADEARDDIHLTLASAIFWYAAAMEAERTEVKTLLFTTAGELFFSSEVDHIVENFATGAAALLAPPGDRTAFRKIESQVVELYKVRSEIVHRGERDKTESAVALRRLIRELIIVVLNRRAEFCNRSALLSAVRT